MSDATTTLAKDLASTAVDLCWRQWSTLRGAGAPVAQAPTRSVIDPEALVLLSLQVRHHEARLTEALAWWAIAGSTLLSVQRIRTLAKTLPESIAPDLSWFAGRCVEAGDRRFRSLVLPKTRKRAKGTAWAVAEPKSQPTPKGPVTPQLLLPPSLVLQLRAGLGVGAKADLLAFLIGMTGTLREREAWASADAIAKGISYSNASVRRATTEMALARFVRRSSDRPAQYAIDAQAWVRVLDLRIPDAPTELAPPPPWRFWAQMSGFFAHALDWCETSRQDDPVVQASQARDVAETFATWFRYNGIVVPDAARYPDERYLEAFGGLVTAVAAWCDAEL